MPTNCVRIFGRSVVVTCHDVGGPPCIIRRPLTAVQDWSKEIRMRSRCIALQRPCIDGGLTEDVTNLTVHWVGISRLWLQT